MRIIENWSVIWEALYTETESTSCSLAIKGSKKINVCQEECLTLALHPTRLKWILPEDGSYKSDRSIYVNVFTEYIYI